jgi:hypothetical protein
MVMVMRNGVITEEAVDPFANEPADVFITLSQTAPTGAPQGGTMDEMGATVPGLQSDSPYTPADQVLLPGQGETPLTADVPYNVSDQAAPNGFNSSASGALKDGGGFGEWVTNGFKSLTNGFLGTMNRQTTATSQQSGGSFGSPNPGLTNFSRANVLPLGGASGTGSGIQGATWMVILLFGLILIFGLMRGR